MNERNIEEKIISEERVFTGNLVKVNRLEVILPDGKSASREAVRHPGAAAIVPVDENGMVTLVRQYRAPIADVLLEIPAGKLDHKGEDRLEAAKRELQEETGLQAERWTHLVDLVTAPGFCDEMISIYLAQGLSEGEDHPDEDEFLNAVKIPFAELMEMAARGELTDSKTLAGVLLAARHINS